MSETQLDMNAYEASLPDPIEVFRRVPLTRMVWIYLALDFGISIPVMISIPIDDQITKLIISAVLLVVFLVGGYMVWSLTVRNRQRCVCWLKPGVYILASKQLVAWDQSSDEPLSEEEQISLHDQASKVLKFVCVGDWLINLGLLVYVLIYPIATDPSQWWIRSGVIVVAAALILRLVMNGDAFVPGLNRLRIDPDGWRWGEWSTHLKKTGRWEDTRVLIKPITKYAQDRYFVVLGNDDGTIGMIVPKASIELIKRAYVSTPRITTLPDDSHLCPAN